MQGCARPYTPEHATGYDFGFSTESEKRRSPIPATLANVLKSKKPQWLKSLKSAIVVGKTGASVMSKSKSTAPAATESTAPAKPESKINWGSVAKDTAIIGGATVGSVVAVGVVYGVIVKVASATYNALS